MYCTDAVELLEEIAEKYPDRKIVCLDYDDKPIFINEIELDEESEDDTEWKYILSRDDSNEGFMTVGDLLDNIADFERDRDEGEEGEYDVLLIRYESDDENCLKSISEADAFFTYTVDGEEVIAFRLGDDYYCDDDDFFGADEDGEDEYEDEDEESDEEDEEEEDDDDEKDEEKKLWFWRKSILGRGGR